MLCFHYGFTQCNLVLDSYHFFSHCLNIKLPLASLYYMLCESFPLCNLPGYIHFILSINAFYFFIQIFYCIYDLQTFSYCLFIFLCLFFFFFFYFILPYNTVLVLPYIDVNLPRVYMRSQT